MAYLSLRVLYTLLPTMTMIGQVALMTMLNFKVYFLESTVINFLVLSDVVRN
jgi:hypothetical protein